MRILRSLRSRIWFCCLLSSALLVGCSKDRESITTLGALPWHEYTDKLNEATLFYVIGIDPTEPDGRQRLACIILTDLEAPHQIGGSTHGTAEGFQSLPNGGKITWQCETPDGESGTVLLNGQSYDLSKGGIFLVSTRDANIRVLQLNRDISMLKTDGIKTLMTGISALIDGDIEPFFSNTERP